MKDSFLQTERDVSTGSFGVTQSVREFRKIREEKNDLEEKRIFLEKMEGWERLTERQRKMILASFLVWSRATRETDVKEASFVTRDSRGVSVKDEECFHEGLARPYRVSQNIVSRMFCHMAVSCLENEEIPLLDFLRKNGFSEKDVFGTEEWDRYFTLDWTVFGRDKYVSVFEEISAVGFPCVVYWGQFESEVELQEWNKKKHFPILHSCVALGRSEEEDIAIWEKKGRGTAFQIVSLRDMCNRYSWATHFFVRPLENKQSLSGRQNGV